MGEEILAGGGDLPHYYVLFTYLFIMIAILVMAVLVWQRQTAPKCKLQLVSTLTELQLPVFCC